MTGWGPFDLTGKNAVVTGAAQGIGFGIATRFLEAGANVLIADLSGEAAEAAAEKLGGAGRVVAMQADVAQEDAGEAIVARCVEAFGSIDILVNNAAIYPPVPVLEMSTEMFDRTLQINLRGTVFCAKAAVAQMVLRGDRGKIVNLASIDAFHPSSSPLAAYGASKAGVVMFTKAFAAEVGRHGINVNAIAPGGIMTEGIRKLSGPPQPGDAERIKQAAAAFIARIPVGRFGAPDDIAKVAVFLASSASDYMTGETVIVDGGFLLS
ncbi:MAG: SDR family oxidoreductase [Actinobacteria bacterium]|nr:SDR family oxidoreductase [Actinomycetota bacterium]